MIEKYVDTEELRRLLATLIIVLCALAVAGLFAILVVPGLRNANKPPTPTAVSPVIGESGWLDPTEFPPEKGRVIPPVDPDTLLKPSPELASRGKELFEGTCVQCHGARGQGDGVAATTMNPRPRNFASPDGWINGYDLPGIFKTLSEGIANSSMASFSYISRRDRMALAHYVQSLGNFSHESKDSGKVQILARELGSAGEKIPNKIPVSMAMARLEDEFTLAKQPGISLDSPEPGNNMLRRAIWDPSRAAQVLGQSQLWRASASLLAEAILPDVPENGFSVDIAKFSPSEWKTLHAQLLMRIKQK